MKSKKRSEEERTKLLEAGWEVGRWAGLWSGEGAAEAKGSVEAGSGLRLGEPT